MAWTKVDSIRGPQGEKGKTGTIASASAATLPPGSAATVHLMGDVDPHMHIGVPQGAQGDRGPAGAISSASAESVPAESQAAAIMTGTEDVKHLHLQVPRGLPGVNAVPTAEAVGTYLQAGDSGARPGFDAGSADLIADDSSSAAQAVEKRIDEGFPARFKDAFPIQDPVATLANVSVLAAFPFRSVLDQGWVQGFSLDEEAQLIYLARQVNGEKRFTIEVRTFDGVLVEAKSFATEDIVYIESLPWWKDDAGSLFFIARRQAKASYAIVDFTAGTMSDSIDVLGGYYAWAVEGDAAFTATAYHATQGGVPATFLTEIFEYSFASLKAGNPVLVRRIAASPRGLMPAKMQGWQALNGQLIFSGGNEGTGPTFVSIGLDGHRTNVTAFSKPNFADALNASRPGLITNRDDFTHEAESIWASRGRLLSGHVVGNGVAFQEIFAIVQHGIGSGATVALVAPKLQSGAAEMELQAANPRVLLRSENGSVNLWLDGGLQIEGGVVALAPGEEKTFLPAESIPDWLWPSRVRRFTVPIGNALQVGALTIGTDGSVKIKNMGAANAGNINAASVDYPVR